MARSRRGVEEPGTIMTDRPSLENWEFLMIREAGEAENNQGIMFGGQSPVF